MDDGKVGLVVDKIDGNDVVCTVTEGGPVSNNKGLSLPGAKSRVQRARQRLREQLSAACQVKFDGAGQVCCFVPRPPLD